MAFILKNLKNHNMKKPIRLKVIRTVFENKVHEIYKLENSDGSITGVGIPKAKEAINIYGLSHAIYCESTAMYYFNQN